jgi:DNA primase
MIPHETIERVREAADIVEIIGEHVKLRRTGSEYRGPCPLHGGKNPNFAVSPSKGVFHCHKCHESGDVFTFLQKQLGLDYVDAVRAVAARYGIEVRESPAARAERDAREPFWEVNAAAGEYFQRALWDTPDGKAARAYLERRQVGRDVAERFGIGYAPTGRALKSHLLALGYDEARLLEVGLLVRREEGDDSFPRFRDRLMFPIHDVGGHPIGFGGRLLADAEGAAKYLNSPESRVFSKRAELYNLDAAKNAIRKEERVLVVEGYFDVVRLVAAGIGSVVAGLGTALTEQHVERLSRYTKNVFLLYDSDEAGQKATFRAGLEFLRHGAAVRVVTLPEGEDPDSYVAKHGAAKLEAQLDAAIDLFDRQVQILERRGWFADLHRKRRALDKLLPTLRATADPLTRDIYVARASEVAGVDRETLLREVNETPERPRGAARRTPGRGAPAPDSGAPRPDEGPPVWDDAPPAARFPPYDGGGRGGGRGKRRFNDRGRGDRRGEWMSVDATPRTAADGAASAERQLAAIMLADRSLVARIAERCPTERFRDHNYREIFAALVRLGPEAMFDEIEAVLSPDAGRVLSLLVERGPAFLDPMSDGVDITKTVDGALAQLRRRELDERSAVLKAELRGATDEEATNRLIRELNDINRQIQALGHGRFKTSGFGGQG